ncbi:hypothetical protein DP117_18155 [Brasilonema sp. UFV-L1]|nr:hypothetical protein [Brasilonema sp. UFV-L1]
MERVAVLAWTAAAFKAAGAANTTTTSKTFASLLIWEFSFENQQSYYFRKLCQPYVVDVEFLCRFLQT